MPSEITKIARAAGYPDPPWVTDPPTHPGAVAGNAAAIFDAAKGNPIGYSERDIQAWTKVFKILLDDGVISIGPNDG